jgi:hypothetical protein
VNWNWQARQHSTPTDSDTLIRPNYGLLNARLEYTLAKHWTSNVGSVLYDLGGRANGVSARALTSNAQPCCSFGSTEILLRSTPIPLTSTSTMSPDFIHNGGVRREPTPPGVPVEMRSPAANGVKREM